MTTDEERAVGRPLTWHEELAAESKAAVATWPPLTEEQKAVIRSAFGALDTESDVNATKPPP